MVEVGKTYKTKMGDGSSFEITKIEGDRTWGYFIKKDQKWDVLCPLPMERLLYPKPKPPRELPTLDQLDVALRLSDVRIDKNILKFILSVNQDIEKSKKDLTMQDVIKIREEIFEGKIIFEINV